MLPIFYNLSATLREIFSFRNIVLQAIACFLTYIIVISGFDWAYFKSIQIALVSPYLFPATIIGGILPIFGLPLLYVVAKITKKRKLLTFTWALAQSAMLGWCISSFYKAFTGRVQPPHGLASTLIDASRDWNFGFLKHGIFWGWPSSHTTVAFAMAFAIIALYPKRKDVFFFAFLYAFYIGIGITTRIHWFSEFIAGAIIGTIIGIAIGTSFRKKI
jgi:membrane-associated phospholipid phosphatase